MYNVLRIPVFTKGSTWILVGEGNQLKINIVYSRQLQSSVFGHVPLDLCNYFISIADQKRCVYDPILNEHYEQGRI